MKKLYLIIPILILLLIIVIISNNILNKGIKEISYETVKKKIDKKDTFVFYAGRESCPACKNFYPILERVYKENKLKIYYLNAQPYKNAIDNEEQNAQSNWDSVKQDLGFQFIPYLAYYKHGKLASIFKLEEIIYYEDTEEDKEKQVNYIKEKIKEWLDKNQFE